ncbi:MAG TPA: GGDEF domain-containing protein [Clostridium sp.]|nr:GGDEF domain-containing protein [Clostridium sp.]
MEQYKSLYNNIKKKYIDVSKENKILEKKVDSLYNIVEISNYINIYFRSENLMDMINDMIIGILGVSYSTIFIVENNEMKIKSTNNNIENINLTDIERYNIMHYKDFLINEKETIKFEGSSRNDIHCILGMPIKLREKPLGYILVEHEVYNSLTDDSMLFLRSIANQVAISIENASLYKQLKKMTMYDPLLDIYNRKYFFNSLEKKINKKNSEKFAIIMIDIDDFKKVNDTYGHQFGDKVLKTFADIILRNVSKKDIVARYGGEEIIICINNYNYKEDVYNNIEKIRRELEETRIVDNNNSINITGSFGIAFFPADGQDVSNLIKCADELLYMSKKNGKNTISCNHVYKK